MPWITKKTAQCPVGKPYGVFNKNTRRLIGCHASEEKARKQQAALYAEVGDPADEARSGDDGDIERRTIASEATLEYRDDPTTGAKVPVIVGYAAVFNSESRILGDFIEVIEPRAFDDVLRSNPDVVGVWNHNKDMPLGRISDGRLKLSIDAHGLRYELTPDQETTIGRDVTIWVRNRTVQASSFAFAVDRAGGGEVWERAANGIRLRRITKVKILDDVSPVLRPAYDGTSVVVSRRALEQAAGEAMRPNQTMANAAKRALKLVEKREDREDVDPEVVRIADQIASREIVTSSEIFALSGFMQRCLEAKSPTWSGSKDWLEYQLLGGDSGERWIHRRCADPQAGIAENDESEPQDDHEERASDGVNLRPTAGMAAAARRGLKLHENGRSGDGLKPETVARAKKIAAREALSPSHVREMRAWFRRHKVDRRPGWDKSGDESPGFTAWMLWGGAPAWRWSEAKVLEMERAAGRRADDGDMIEAAEALLSEFRSHGDYEDEPMSTHPDKISMVYAAIRAAEEQYGAWTKDDERYMEGSPCRGDGYTCRLMVDVRSDDGDADDKPAMRSSEGGEPSEPAGDEASATAVADPPPAKKNSDEDDVIAALAAMNAVVLATHLHGSSQAE